MRNLPSALAGQGAEKYFDNLSVTKGSDDFARPANVWKLKAEKIGTYAATTCLVSV